MILILSRRDDMHVAFLSKRLERIGAEFALADPSEFPSSMAMSFERGVGLRQGTLRLRERTIDLDEIRSVWWRRPGRSEAPDWIEDTVQRANISELGGAALGGVWETLDCLWVPCKPSAKARANHKLWQLDLAQRIGFIIPETLVANDPEQFLRFYSAHGGQIVTKALTPFVGSTGQPTSAATQLVARRSLRRVCTVRHEAVIAQAFVPKALELRITVVGSRVFCAAINSGSVRRATVDWRTAQDYVEFKEHPLPRAIALRCVRLARQMGLTFGALDMIVTPDGQHVFLEINPTGQWAFMPKVSGDIADALASLLAHGKTSRGEPAP